MRAFLRLLVCVVVALAGIAHGQSPRDDALKCRSATLQPRLDFDFRFVAGHWFSLPVKQFWEREVDLRVVMEVEPINGTPGEMKRVAHRLQATQPVPQGVSGEFNFPARCRLVSENTAAGGAFVAVTGDRAKESRCSRPSCPAKSAA